MATILYIYVIIQEKFQITDPAPKFGSLVFRVLTEMELLACRPLMKKSKIDCDFMEICIIQKKFRLPTPPPPIRSLGLWFSKCQQKWNIGVSHYKKNQTMAAIS